MKDEINTKCFLVGIYVRESRDDNEENYETIETQRELLVDFARKNNIGRIAGIYEDNNVSGSVFDRRGIEQLKRDVITGKINLLLLKDLSRLGRNNAKTLLFLDFLEEYGVTVLTSDGRYDSRRDNDTVGIDTWYNERYVRDISRKIRANLRFKIQKGEYIGHAPYGYKKSDESKNRLIIDCDKAMIVREIFDLYLKGFGYASIAGLMDQKGYQPPGGPLKGRNGWNPVAVGRILGNRVYLGHTVQGVSEKVSFKSRKTRRLPKENWVITENTHEPIITPEQFDSVQKLLTNRKAFLTGPHKGVIHIFRGLLTCGGCGGTMIARQRKNRPMGYICANYARMGNKACSSHYVNERMLEAEITNEVHRMFRSKSLREWVKDRLKKGFNENDTIHEEIARLEQQLLQKQHQQDILYQDRLEGKISGSLFERTNKVLENSMVLINSELAHLKSAERSFFDPEALIDGAEAALSESGLTNRLARLMVENITVFQPGDKIDDKKNEGISDFDVQKLHQLGGLIVSYRWADWQ